LRIRQTWQLSTQKHIQQRRSKKTARRAEGQVLKMELGTWVTWWLTTSRVVGTWSHVFSCFPLSQRLSLGGLRCTSSPTHLDPELRGHEALPLVAQRDAMQLGQSPESLLLCGFSLFGQEAFGEQVLKYFPVDQRPSLSFQHSGFS
jgi:hypothetical protein